MIAASATAAAALAAPPVVRAEESSFGGGVFVGYNVGAHPGVEWGFEVFATRLLWGTGECVNDNRGGVGGLAQIALIGSEQPRFTLAAHGGGELSRNGFALSGELGASYRLGPRPGFGIHTGIVPQAMFLNAAARYQFLLNDAWFGGGARIQPTYGEVVMCAIGRPLRTDSGLAAVGPALRVDDERASLAAGERIAEVGHAYERDAQLEYASVPAFLQLASDLALQGAPPSLIRRALDAAGDELRHAAQCAGLASRHLGQRVEPLLPEPQPRTPATGHEGLVRLAVESWIDGCLAEGTAAAHAARAAAVSEDRDARALHQRVAVDERRHAELAWSIVQWTLACGGDQIGDVLHALRDVEAAEVREPAPGGLQKHGRLEHAALAAIDRQERTASRARLDALLA